MYASTSFTSQLVHDLLMDSPSRKLLLQEPLQYSPAPISSYNSTDSYFRAHEFDANVVMILSVLLCAVICSLGLNSIIRCVLKCSNIVINDPPSATNINSPSPRLANTGIKKKALRTFPTITYSTELKLPGLDTECVICLSEFTNGDKVRILPKCNHGFHVRCIDKWLSSHSSCPKCRQCLIETCKKIVSSVPQVPQTTIRIQPLEPEAFERNYREVYAC